MRNGGKSGVPISRLTARNAAISTATIEIGTLTLDGKQPALSVFRQLIEEPILVAPLCDLPQLFIAV